MSNPTSNFGWQMPTNTDLVTNLPADFEVFGQAVDSDFADLKGGTSGQILSKNSNTDLDFVWVDNQVGDITAVTATSPLTGGGTTGAITVGIQAASTTQSGAVQLTDSTSSTSTTTAATPNSVKTSYDLAVGAIPKSLIDAAGDLIVGTAADTAGRLAIGSAGQVLKVNSGATALEWGTSPSGKIIQVVNANLTTTASTTSSTFVDTGLEATITPTLSSSKILVIVSIQLGVAQGAWTALASLFRGSTNLLSPTSPSNRTPAFSALPGDIAGSQYVNLPAGYTYLDSPSSTSALTYKVRYNCANGTGYVNRSAADADLAIIGRGVSTITLIEVGA
jgi:hypothetical protein